MSLQKVRDSLVYCLADKVIDCEEFVLLYNPYKSKNAAYLYWEYEEFCLDSLSSEAEAFAIHSGSHCHFDTSLGCPEIKLENARVKTSECARTQVTWKRILDWVHPARGRQNYE